ncbi:MAG: glycosyltransferase family 4 protein [FCB group bacterium]|nr:glycosyltransferase family 4 protein [FCB group bacterium]
MHIVVNARFLTQKISGVQRYAMEISRQLKKLSPNISFVTPKNVVHKKLAQELKVDCCGHFTGHLWEQLELPRYMRKEGKKGLLLCLGNTAPLFYKKKVVTIHDLGFLRYPQWCSKKFYYFYKFLIPRIVKNSLKIITDSEFSKKEIMTIIGLSNDIIDVIYSGIASRFFDINDGETVNKYGNYILAVSSLAPNKNFPRVVEAFLKLHLENMKLVITGIVNKNSADGRLPNLINNQKNVILTGYVNDDELINLYRQAKLFVYPSLYEGFGLPPLEAMACGCPCVVSKAASLPEVCGDAALYCDPYSIDDIADKISRLLVNEKLRAELIKRGLERAKKYSWEKAAKEILKIIDSAIALSSY